VRSIITNDIAVNVNWAGINLDALWTVGVGGGSFIRGLNLHDQFIDTQRWRAWRLHLSFKWNVGGGLPRGPRMNMISTNHY
jgi:hypothetical protein